MNKINLLWIAILFLFGIATGYFGKKYFAKKERNNPKTHRVGFIFPESKNTVTLDTAKTHWQKKLIGAFAGSYPQIYKGSKYQFRQNLLSAFNADKYQDNGYFNLRFLH